MEGLGFMSFSASSDTTPDARYEVTLGPAQMIMPPQEILAPPLVVNVKEPSNIPTLLIGISLLTAVLVFTGTLRLGSK